MTKREERIIRIQESVKKHVPTTKRKRVGRAWDWRERAAGTHAGIPRHGRLSK